MAGTPVWKQELFCNPTRPMDYPVGPFPVIGQKSISDFDLLRPQPFPRDPTIAIEPSYEITLTSFVAFDQKISPLYPNNFNLNPQVAFESWKMMSANCQFSKLHDLVDTFTYCVVFGHGAKLIGNDLLSMEFTTKGEAIAHALFIAPSVLCPDFYATHADTLVACATLLGVLKLESGDFNGARLNFIQAYNVLNMNVSQVTARVAHRLYAHLAGMSRSTIDMNHWLSNAHSLGPEASTPINRVILSLLYCSPSLLRDPKNKVIPLFLQIPSNSAQVPLKDQTLYKNMLRELDETEAMIWDSEVTKDNNASSDYITSFKIIIDGCRAMVFAQSGYADQASICAEKCIRDSKSLQARVSYWALPVTLAYSLQVVKTINNQALFNEGLPLLSLYAEHYPIVTQIVQILSTKNLEANPSALDLPLQMGLNSAPFGIGMPNVPGVNMGGMDMGWFPPMGMGVPGIMPGMFTNVVPSLVGGTMVALPVSMNGMVSQGPGNSTGLVANTGENPSQTDTGEQPSAQAVLSSMGLPLVGPLTGHDVNTMTHELGTVQHHDINSTVTT